jgi:Primase C terminal 1 (PriCT-1)
VSPSTTNKGDYLWVSGQLGTTPLPDAPEWLIELLRERPKAIRGEGENSPRRTKHAALDDSPIPAGEGNVTLTSIAGKLNDGTRTLAELEAALAEENARRCQRPLPDTEIQKIARSIHGRKPCKASVDVSPEVLAALDLIEEDMWDRPERWSGKAGLSQWKMKYALIHAAREYGKMIPTGVRVSLSRRDLAERAGVSLSTVQSNIPRMKKGGHIRTDNLNRYHDDDKSGAFVLPFVERSNSVHSSTTTELLRTTELMSVPDLSDLKKLRHAAPGVWRVGPRAGMATLALLRSGCTLSYEQLASKLGISRGSNLRRKGGVLERMVSVGMVECSETNVSLTPTWNDALKQAREEGREEQAEMRQRRQREEQQRRYRLYKKGLPSP